MATTNGSMNGTIGRTSSYREMLFAMQAELLSNLRLELTMLIGPENVASEEWSQLLHHQHVANKLNQIDLFQLQMLTTALQRLEGDRCGVCVECGAPISDRRLMTAIPWTNRCIRCQERSGSSQASSHNRSQVD